VLGCRWPRRDRRRGISPDAVTRLKARGRELTRRPRGRRIERVAPEGRRSRRGWQAHVGDAEVRSRVKAWDSGMQRRLRGYRWKPWGQRGDKAPRQRGVRRDVAWHTAKSAPGPWRLSRRPARAMAWPGRYGEGLGVSRLSRQGPSPPHRRGP
jgi:RNA-directed DNA polymerase